MIKKLFTLLFCLSFGGVGAWSQELRFEDLSLEEKLGQTLTVFVDVDSAEIFRPVIESGKVGGVLIQWGNYSLAQTKQLIDKLQSWAAKSPHKIPLLISIDYEGGTVYTPITLGFDYLPTNMMLSASGDEEGAATIAYLAGLELKRTGVHINFSPVLDVNSNPHNPIIGVRSFGSDPANVTKMGISLMNGFKAAGIVSVVKHFPGHGDTSVDSHYQVPIVKASYQDLEKTHIAPFAQAVKHGAQGVMTSHIIYPALDNKNIATFSKPIVQDLLKEQLGYKGLVVTDSLDMKAATQFCTIANCAVRALNTGSDMILLGRYIKPQTTFANIYKNISANAKSTARVNEAAEKIFNLKKELGLLDGSSAMPPPIDKAYREELEKMSNRAVTLVRDRVKLLPFNPEVLRGKKPTVCAIFFSPSRFADQLPSFTKPFMEKGWDVRGYNAALTPKAVDAKRAKECAEGADLLVVTSLQWADKTNINQKNTIQALFKENPRNVFISTMSPYDIANYPAANTVLATYGLNRYVLQAAADIILGNLQPQGKLPVSLPVTQ
ncbi:MAG: glycoside hydrolase family 3 C-terminal domain-containing protein [Elusimicrobiaceae bacterium]|nr:glycoside hydrolase family 3 C-terminal domain-containing protein [Elusimicrobiaceae bacterium]